MPDNQKIINAITSFLIGGDTSNIKMLSDVLHKDFRLSSDWKVLKTILFHIICWYWTQMDAGS